MYVPKEVRERTWNWLPSSHSPSTRLGGLRKTTNVDHSRRLPG